MTGTETHRGHEDATGATIRVRRIPGLRARAFYADARNTKIAIYIDGRRVARLRLHETVRVAVTPGVHAVQARSLVVLRSPVVTVAPSASEIVTLQVKEAELSNRDALGHFAAMTRPLELEHVHGGERPPQRGPIR